MSYIPEKTKITNELMEDTCLERHRPIIEENVKLLICKCAIILDRHTLFVK
jgi:hypothetical protein